MSIAVTVRTHITVVDTDAGVYISSDDATRTYDGMNTTSSYTASTTPPVTKFSAGTITLSSGTGSVNLAALSGRTADETVVGTGLKVQTVKLRNKSTNANAITIAEGASNGHPLLGAAFSIILQPSQSITFANEGVDTGTDIASGDRVWDVTGTGSQVLEYMIVMG